MLFVSSTKEKYFDTDSLWSTRAPMKLTVVAKYCMWQNRMHNPGEQNKTTRRHTQPHCLPWPCPGHSPCRNRPKSLALMGSIFWMPTPHSRAWRNKQDQCQRETRHRYGRTRWAKKNRCEKIGPRDRGGESAAGVVYRLGFLSAFSPACLRLLSHWRLYFVFGIFYHSFSGSPSVTSLSVFV